MGSLLLEAKKRLLLSYRAARISVPVRGASAGFVGAASGLFRSLTTSSFASIIHCDRGSDENVVSSGANFFASFRQLPTTDVGATTSVGAGRIPSRRSCSDTPTTSQNSGRDIKPCVSTAITTTPANISG